MGNLRGRIAKPTLGTRIKTGMRNMGRKIARKVSNSPIGKAYRLVKGFVVKVGKVVAAIYRAVKKTVKAVYGFAKFTYKAAKAGVKMFLKASRFVGRMAVRGAVKVAKGIKSFVMSVKSGKIGSAIMNFSGAKIINKLGWRAIKFVSRKLWSGIKKLAFKAVSFFAGLFGVLGKFMNKLGNWMTRLGKWVKDKTYRFILKPISQMVVTLFDFFIGVVASPFRFLKWITTTVFDRIRNTMHNIKSAARRTLRATWGVFKRILFHPLTLVLLIGGIFLIFRKSLFGWLGKMVRGIKNSIVPVVKFLASHIWEFIKGAWNVISTVGKFLFDVVKWLTDPDGWIAKVIMFVIRTFMEIKRGISKMGEVSGYADNIDMLCMFISGDMIGIAIHFIVGIVRKLWDYVRREGIVKTMINLVKGLLKLHVMIWAIPFTILESLGRAVACALQPWKWNKIGEQFALPWKRWWNAVKKIFNGEDADTSNITFE